MRFGSVGGVREAGQGGSYLEVGGGGRGIHAAGGFIRAAGHRTHSGGGRSFLGSGNKKDGGGFWHQSQNPRCSERRKSFRIST